jgi:hypothetical protein
LGFFGLLREDARRLIALKARVLVECAVDRIEEMRLVHCFLLVGFPGHRRAQIDPPFRITHVSLSNFWVPIQSLCTGGDYATLVPP